MSSTTTSISSSAMGFNSHVLQVSFVSPVKVSDHTEYIIQVSISGKTWQCQRRYKEFDELHNKLRRVNSDLHIPSLPPKKWFGNMAPQFVSQRQAGLQSYVDELLADPRWASMHILRAFFDTHRHMNDSQQDNSNGQGKSSGLGMNAVTNTSDGSNAAIIEAEAMEAEDQRRDEIVERAEKLMVEIYAAPPVLDATAAAEQVEEVEDALSKRSDELIEAISKYRESLLKVKQKAEEDNTNEETKSGVEINGVVDESLLIQKAQNLIENFRQEPSA
jgi:hypothetical protein